MKILGTIPYDANHTTTANSLANALMIKPEISMNIANLFEDNFTALTSFLARRGLTKKGLYPGLEEPKFKMIGNRKFMWAMKGYPFRKGVCTADASSAIYSDKLGLNGSVFTITLDTNFFSPYDVLELRDRRTYVTIMNEYPVETTAGNWEYKVKLNHNTPGRFIPSSGNGSLLLSGAEVGFSHTNFPELSEKGYEKNTYPEWHTNFMTTQRMSFSISGTANELVLVVEHNGQKLWVKSQDIEMMRRWTYARENQLLFAPATVDEKDTVYLKDLDGKDIMAGDGLLPQGEGSLKFQYNKLSFKVLDTVIQNMQLMSTGSENVEIFVMGGQKFIWDFSRLLTDTFKFNPQPLFMSEAGIKQGLRANFSAYETPYAKFVVAWNPAFNAAWRPQSPDANGNNAESSRAIMIGIGGTVGSDPNIELMALGNRSFVKKTVNGMTSISGSNSKEEASSSIDGASCHILSETGICLKNRFSVAELYVPTR